MCHMSRVTCHVSLVMCRVSHVMGQVSHVICHMSSVICHMSHVICRVSNVMCQVSHFFGPSGGASRARVCYQQGLPRLVVTEWRPDQKHYSVRKSPHKSSLFGRESNLNKVSRCSHPCQISWVVRVSCPVQRVQWTEQYPGSSIPERITGSTVPRLWSNGSKPASKVYSTALETVHFHSFTLLHDTS